MGRPRLLSVATISISIGRTESEEETLVLGDAGVIAAAAAGAEDLDDGIE